MQHADVMKPGFDVFLELYYAISKRTPFNDQAFVVSSSDMKKLYNLTTDDWQQVGCDIHYARRLVACTFAEKHAAIEKIFDVKLQIKPDAPSLLASQKS